MSRRPESGAGVATVDLSGKTALVTGATSGVGRETALALARLGATVVVHGRDRQEGATVVAELRELGSDGSFHPAEFTNMAEVRELAATVRDEVDHLDLLVNNAGAHFRRGELTADGVERTIAVNHLAPFLLTNLLVPSLADEGRVVTVSSEVHHGVTLDLTAFESVEGYDGLEAYRRSKHANVLFTTELARRLDGPTANCCHPGLVPGSGIWRDASLPVKAATTVLAHLPRRLTGGRIDTPATAAETSVYLAASPAVASTTGRYFADGNEVEPEPSAVEETAARRLWEWSADVTGLDGAVPDTGTNLS